MPPVGAALLASATPLIEDYAKAEMGIYKLLRLPKRIGDLPLPRIHIVDMKQEFKCGKQECRERFICPFKGDAFSP